MNGSGPVVRMDSPVPDRNPRRSCRASVGQWLTRQ